MKRTLAALVSLILLLSLPISASAMDAFGQYAAELPGEVAIQRRLWKGYVPRILHGWS